MNAVRLRALLATVAILALVRAALGQSGGLYLPENGGPISGTAQAGSAAVARDAETAWLNPAGMTRLGSPQVMLTVMPVYVDFAFEPSSASTASGSDGGNQGGWIPAGALFSAFPVGDDVAVGFSITSPAGLVLDPSDDWVARSWTTRSALAVLDFQPSLGLEIAEELSIGFGLDVQYLVFDQELRGPIAGTPLDIDGDSWEVGFTVSLLWEPAETTRVGLRYRSEVDHELSGDLTVSAGRPVDTSFTLPMSVTLSGYHDVSEDFALLADVGWTDWSAFDRNVITFDSSGLSTELPRNFQDVWTVALGAHRRLGSNALLMLGAGYTSSAVDDANRTPDLPVDEQVRLSVGGELALDEQWKIGGSYTLIWLGANDIDQTRPLTGRVAGDYDAYAHVFGIYGSVAF